MAWHHYLKQSFGFYIIVHCGGHLVQYTLENTYIGIGTAPYRTAYAFLSRCDAKSLAEFSLYYLRFLSTRALFVQDS
jgi:hypothetical protein